MSKGYHLLTFVYYTHIFVLLANNKLLKEKKEKYQKNAESVKRINNVYYELNIGYMKFKAR